MSNSAKKKFDVYVDGGSDLVDSDSSKTIVRFNDKMTVADVAKAVDEFIKKEYGIKESDDFEPHWMYDPETGEKERAEKPEDHERLKALGWGHEPPVNEAKIDNYVASLAKKYNALKTIDPNSKDWKDLVKQLSNLSDADLKKVVDAKIKWASMMAEPMLKYGKFADKRHGGSFKEGKVFEETYPKKLEKATTQADILKLYPKAKFSNRNLFGKPHPGGVVALTKTMALKFYFKDKDHRGTKMAKTDKFDVWAIWYYKPGSRKPISVFGDFFKSK